MSAVCITGGSRPADQYSDSFQKLPTLRGAQKLAIRQKPGYTSNHPQRYDHQISRRATNNITVASGGN